MSNKMIVTVSASGKADATLSLQQLQAAVAITLRKEGVAIATSNVCVEGKLA